MPLGKTGEVLYNQKKIRPAGDKSRDITLLTKVRLVKAMVFPVVMYGCGVIGEDS